MRVSHPRNWSQRQKRIGAAGAGVAGALVIGAGVLFGSGSGGSIDVFVGSTPTPVGGGGTSLACESSTKNVAGGVTSTGSGDPTYGCWPSATNTGVPSGTSLTTYTGSCTITADNTVITQKTIDCNGQMTIAADNVQFSKVKFIASWPWIDTPGSGTFTMDQSEVDGGPDGDHETTGKSGFTITRSYFHGGHRGVWCEYNCSLTNSYICCQAQQTDPPPTACHNHTSTVDLSCAWHEAGARIGSGNGTSTGVQVLRHNTMVCDTTDVNFYDTAGNDPLHLKDSAGCSADISGYGDFGPIQHNTVDKNLFLSTPGGTCTYGGNTPSHDFPNGGNNAFTNNVYVKDPSTGHCGFNFSSVDNNTSLSGNVFSGNVLWTASTQSSVTLTHDQ